MLQNYFLRQGTSCHWAHASISNDLMVIDLAQALDKLEMLPQGRRVSSRPTSIHEDSSDF